MEEFVVSTETAIEHLLQEDFDAEQSLLEAVEELNSRPSTCHIDDRPRTAYRPLTQQSLSPPAQSLAANDDEPEAEFYARILRTASRPSTSASHRRPSHSQSQRGAEVLTLGGDGSESFSMTRPSSTASTTSISRRSNLSSPSSHSANSRPVSASVKSVSVSPRLAAATPDRKSGTVTRFPSIHRNSSMKST